MQIENLKRDMFPNAVDNIRASSPSSDILKTITSVRNVPGFLSNGIKSEDINCPVKVIDRFMLKGGAGWSGNSENPDHIIARCRLNSGIDRNQRDIDNLERMVSRAQRDLAQLERACNNDRNQLRNMAEGSADYNQMQRSIEEAERDMRRLQADIDSVNGEIRVLQNENRDMQNQLNALG
ncbi:hypothetical protein BTJ39_05880 [Izhakiella australiensis]|uniref:Uncharacterized protein n=1 Tax=Izhakiella australiensis TaxID=1926881 RepID=A0A1S8YS53_9GAMM|nr:hypothetical protein [Izhakiella australiensis]OON41483.1 hypothetical protein BTJ39_05880 [Izhakiella australiensis]